MREPMFWIGPPRRLLVTCLLVGCLLSPTISWSYTPDVTHPGLTSTAALNSRLHRFLRDDHGLILGLFSDIAIVRTEANRRAYRLLQYKLRRLDPAGGYRPIKDQMRAIGWLMAGSVLADMPGSVNRHHFYDPIKKKGLDDRSPLAGGLLSLLSTVEGNDSVRQLLTGSGFDLSGKSALAWIRSPHHGFSVQRFYKALHQSVAAPLPQQREHHLAKALMALGGLLNVLQDMSVPEHVRNDYVAARTQRIGNSSFDRGSAYERWVARAYGQSGLPGRVSKRVLFKRLGDYFSNAKRTGLADLTSRAFFSPGTLPQSLPLPTTTPRGKLAERLNKRLRFAEPRLTAPPDLACAMSAGSRSCYVRDSRQQPLLAYRYDSRSKLLQFYVDYRCMANMARTLLPLALNYSAGLIDYLLRGEIKIEGENLSHTELATGTLQVFAQEREGRRRSLASCPLPGSTAECTKHLKLNATDEAKATKVIFAISGRDAAGEQLYMVKTVAIQNDAAPASAPAQAVWEEPISKPSSQPAASQPAASQPATKPTKTNQ